MSDNAAVSDPEPSAERPISGGKWSQLSDSNRQPPDYKSGALPIEAKLALFVCGGRREYAQIGIGRKS